jgi:hypothetical protein
MRIPHLKHQFVSLFSCAVTHTVDLERLLKTLCDTLYHVGNERATKAMQSTVKLLIRRPGYFKMTISKLNADIGMEIP